MITTANLEPLWEPSETNAEFASISYQQAEAQMVVLCKKENRCNLRAGLKDRRATKRGHTQLSTWILLHVRWYLWNRSVYTMKGVIDLTHLHSGRRIQMLITTKSSYLDDLVAVIVKPFNLRDAMDISRTLYQPLYDILIRPPEHERQLTSSQRKHRITNLALRRD